MENSMEVPQKIKNRVSRSSNSSSPGHIPRENFDSKRYMQPSVHSSAIHHSQGMEATLMYINRWMNKESCNIDIQTHTYTHTDTYRGFPSGLAVKNPPAMQEMWEIHLGWEDPLEKAMATYSSILSWRIPWTEKPSGLQSMGSHRVGHGWSDLVHSSMHTT